MNFIFVNQYELSALCGLPHIQQLLYLVGLRPYMDRTTFIVGIKRRISYQSLREALYIEPYPGIKSGSPSQQQIKRALKSLQRAGVIKLQSSPTHLILKCLLAAVDKFEENKVDPIPAPHVGLSYGLDNPEHSRGYDVFI
ncbi:MAG: protein LvrA [bacterium]|nr:protein LvrA [bacterium]